MVTTTKFRVVCARCNNEWMSQMEEAVRPTLEPMILGQRLKLPREPRRVLLEWIVLKTMVADSEIAIDAVFSDDDRRAFYQNRSIPQQMEVWAFRCGDGIWNSCFRRQSSTMSFRPLESSVTRQPNVNGTAFGLGEVMLYATVSRSDEFEVKSRFSDKIALRLLPDPGMKLRWPPEKAIRAELAEEISETMERIKRTRGGTWHTT